MGDPKSFLGPYIKYLISNNKTEEAIAFLKKLEDGPEGRFAAVAHILEYKACPLSGERKMRIANTIIFRRRLSRYLRKS
jgi:hypothetical protein